MDDILGNKDVEFVDCLKEDIDSCIEKLVKKKGVLVFPPFIGKYRFLIHKVIDEFFFPQLCSFSLGEGDQRRTLVGSTNAITDCSLPYKCIHEKISCISEKEKEVDCICSTRIKFLLLPSQNNSSKNSSRCHENMKDLKSNKTYPEKESDFSKENQASLRDRQRRPDKLLYVPRALRAQRKVSKSNTEDDSSDKSILHCSGSSLNSSQDSDLHLPSNNLQDDPSCSSLDNPCSESFKLSTQTPTLFQTLESEVRNSETILKIDDSIQEIDSPNTDNQISGSQILFNTNFIETESISDDNQFLEKEIISGIHPSESATNNKVSCEKETFLIKEDCNVKEESSKSNIPVEIYSKVSENKIQSETKETSSANQINDDPTALNDSWETMFNDDGDCLDPEFVNELCKVTGRIEVHVAKNNYRDYQPVSDDISNEFDNIVELFDFPVEFSTQDLVSSLSMFKQEAYTIKWVDDCHALAIFTSPTLAAQALQLSQQFVKIRPLSEGTKESKAKARWCERYGEPCSKPRPATSAVLARRLVSGALGLRVKTTKEQREQERNALLEAKERKKLKAKQRQDMWDGVL